MYSEDRKDVEVGDFVLFQSSFQGDKVLKVSRVTKAYIFTEDGEKWRISDGKHSGNEGGRANMGSPFIIPFKNEKDHSKWVLRLKRREMSDFFHNARYFRAQTYHGAILESDFTDHEATLLWDIYQEAKARKAKK